MQWHCLPSSCLKLFPDVLENLCMLSDLRWTENKSVWLTSLFSASVHTLLHTVTINAVPMFFWRAQDVCIFFVHTKVLLCVMQASANSRSIPLVQKRVILLDGAENRYVLSLFKSYKEHPAQHNLFLQTSSYSLAISGWSVLPSLQHCQQLQLTRWVTCTSHLQVLRLGSFVPSDVGQRN